MKNYLTQTVKLWRCRIVYWTKIVDDCISMSAGITELSDWKKAILENGFGSKELKIAQKLQQETEARLEAAKLLIWKKELEIELLKTKMSSAVKE